MLLLKLGWSWLTGGGFGTLLDFYNRYKDSVDAGERRQAEWAKAQLDAMTENRRLTAGFWEIRVLTFFAAFPFILHVNAVGLDTVFRFGWAVPKWPAPMDTWEGSILLSFFGLAAGVTAIKAASSVLGRIFGK